MEMPAGMAGRVNPRQMLLTAAAARAGPGERWLSLKHPQARQRCGSGSAQFQKNTRDQGVPAAGPSLQSPDRCPGHHPERGQGHQPDRGSRSRPCPAPAVAWSNTDPPCGRQSPAAEPGTVSTSPAGRKAGGDTSPDPAAPPGAAPVDGHRRSPSPG